MNIEAGNCGAAGSPVGAYSVLMSVYAGDHADWLGASLESMAKQTVAPTEIVLVFDGPLGDDLLAVIDTFGTAHPGLLVRVPLAQNHGLGLALNEGIPHCTTDVVMRMDADDLSMPSRCGKQLAKLAEGYDMVGCNISEFSNDPEHPNAERIMPEGNEDVVRFAHQRAPFVHPTFAVRKQALIDVCGYRSVSYAEDYDLFVRLIRAGYKGCNIQESLLRVRVDEGAYRRRGGLSYLRSMLSFNVLQLREGWFSPLDFLRRSLANSVVALMPNGVRDAIYKHLLRRRS